MKGEPVKKARARVVSPQRDKEIKDRITAAAEQVPLEWCFQPAVKLDFRHFEDGYVVTPGDVETELKRIGHELRPLEIVVVNTRAGSRYGEEDYVDAGCGMGKAATMWLLERGIRLVGTDGWSWTRRFPTPSGSSNRAAAPN